MRQQHAFPMRAVIVCILAFAAPATPAFQPLITDDTGTQGADGNQIEFSWNADQVEQGGVTTRSKVLPLVYTRGLTDTLDVFVQANEGGTGNPSFGFKWRFHEDEKSGTSLALKPEARLPLNPRGEPIANVERTSYGITAIVTQQVSFGAIHANLFAGQDSFRDRRDPRGIPPAMGGPLNLPDTLTTRLSLAPVWDITEEFKLALDVGTEHARTAGATSISNFTELGMIWSPGKDLDFAAGIIRSVDDANPRATTTTGTVGVTWRFR